MKEQFCSITKSRVQRESKGRERLQFCWDFVKIDPENDKIALQHFFSFLQQCNIFFSITFVLHAIFFFQQALAGKFFSKSPTHPPLKS